MKELFTKGKRTVSSVAEMALNELTHKYALVKEIVNDLPIFVSSEKTEKYSKEKYDEKHYFVVPFMLSNVGIALHSMRCLPQGVPEINDLPKRRIFHFPNEHSETLVRDLLVDNAREIVETKHPQNTNPLINLANDIDALDKKLTYGMLLVGSMAAVVNPVVGAGIAAKALLPGVTGIVSKYGLRPTGEKMSRFQLKKRIKEAEDSVRKDFEAASTIQVVNPILQELELALSTTEKEHDPLLDFDLSKGNIKELDDERWRELTETALYHVYKDVISDPKKHKDACLGPEDIRWFRVILSGKQR